VIGNSFTLKAIAVAKGDTASSVTSATYTLAVATPQISLSQGTASGSVVVTITCATPNVEDILYTTNGANPNLYSAKYTGPFTITSNTVLHAIGMETGYTASQVASAAVTP
jgi:N-acetyl-beta-hexosaminidase